MTTGGDTLIVGRAHQLSGLAGQVRRVAEGNGGFVWVEGEPGVGKSALVAAGMPLATRLGCRVFRGAADELGRRFPLRILLDCLNADDEAELAAPQEWDAGSGPDLVTDPVLAVAERLLAHVDRLCARTPVVLVLDDLQWIDDASVAVLARLARTVEQLPLLVVLVCRPAPARPDIRKLRRLVVANAALTIPVAPLPPSDTAELVTALVGRPADPKLLALANSAGGNPLYVREAVDALRRENRIRVRNGVAELVTDTPVPASLTKVLADRLAFLSDATIEVLRAAALLGTEFSAIDLATVTGRPVVELAEATDEGMAAGVLAESGPRLAFRHALLRQTVYESVPECRRAELHRRAAQALASADAPVERVAAQLLIALDTMDAWTLDWLAVAGAELTRRAPRIAIDLLRHAVEGMPLAHPRREQLEALFVGALRLLAKHTELERVAGQVLARARGSEHAARMGWALGRCLRVAGRPAEGLDVIESALRDAADHTAWQARLLAAQAEILIHLGRSSCAQVAEQALAAGEAAGDCHAFAYALHAMAKAALFQGRVNSAVEHLDRALVLCGDDPEVVDLRLELMHDRARALMSLDRESEAFAEINAALGLADRSASGLVVMLQTTLATMHYRAGQWDDAVAELDAVLDSHEGRPTLTAHGLRALIAVHRDERAVAARHIAAASRHPARPEKLDASSTYLLLARSAAAERAGAMAEAVAVLATVVDHERGYETEMRFAVLPTLARLALAVGDQSLAHAAVAAAVVDVVDDHSPSRVAAAQWCQGLVDGDVGRLLAAANLHRSDNRPLEVAEILESVAMTLAKGGDTEGARWAFAESVELFDGLGAVWDAVRAESRLAASGVRARPVGPRRPVSGWDALTPSELRVARLVADGLSNPDIAAELFLSRRTVQTHVSHVLRKLGVRSRVEIAREAAGH